MDRTNSRDTCGNWQKYTSANPLQSYLIGRFLRTVGDLVLESDALRVADIGCAEGFVSHHLVALKREIHSTGIDTDFKALRRHKVISPELAVQQASIYRIPYRSKSFDLVLCLEVLEHLQEPRIALAELMRISRRHCLLSVPHEPYFRTANLLRGKNVSRLGDDIDHVNHWGKRGFTAFLEGSGLVVRKMKTSFPWIVALAELRSDG